MKNNNKMYSLGFFSGVGGIDKGAKKAGFTPLLGSDIWPIAETAFNLNKPGIAGHDPLDYKASDGIFLGGKENGDITRMSFELVRAEIRNQLAIDLHQGDVDLVYGGPPCQGMSKANSYASPTDPKNRLIIDYLRMINEIKPKVAVMEQVPDVITSDFISVLNNILFQLKCMPDYTFDWRPLNSKFYGSRQDRLRAIFILVRKDLKVEPSFPAGVEPDMETISMDKLLPHITHYSSGQFQDFINSTKNRVCPTITASASEWVYEKSGIRRKMTLKEKLIFTELEGLNLEGISVVNQNRLLGNMVQISFAEAIFRHIRKRILKR